MIRRTRHHKATGNTSIEIAYGVTSHTPHHRQRPTPPHPQPGSLVHRTLRPPLPRLVLRRGPMPHPHRIRPREHHSPATLRHRTHLSTRAARGRDPATTESKCPSGPRLPQNDRQHSPTGQPLSPSALSTRFASSPPAPHRSRPLPLAPTPRTTPPIPSRAPAMPPQPSNLPLSHPNDAPTPCHRPHAASINARTDLRWVVQQDGFVLRAFAGPVNVLPGILNFLPRS